MTILRLAAEFAAQIKREAIDAAPRECCGLLEGTRTDGIVTALALYPTRNLSQDERRFKINPAQQFEASRKARAHGRHIVGCYHSHPRGLAEPSNIDRQCASEVGFLWLIQTNQLNAFEYRADQFWPVTLQYG